MSGSGPGGRNLCFYSKKCPWCKAFILELAKTPWKTQFQFICVDPGPTRPQLPKWLEKVPTLVISGEDAPRTESDVMNWIFERKALLGGGEGGGGRAAGAEAAGAGEPEAFNMIEHASNGRGVTYSGLDVDTSSQGNGGYSMPGTFSVLNGGASGGDRMSQDLDRGGAQGRGSGGFGGGQAASQKRSKKEEMFDKQMEMYQRDRERGMPQGPRRI
jgi:hypothetical protein